MSDFINELGVIELSKDAQEIKKKLETYDVADKIRTTFLFNILDACGRAGGFMYFAHFVFSFFAKCVNRKLYIKQVVTDSYMLLKNEDYLCVPSGYLSRHNRKTPVGGSIKQN